MMLAILCASLSSKVVTSGNKKTRSLVGVRVSRRGAEGLLLPCVSCSGNPAAVALLDHAQEGNTGGADALADVRPLHAGAISIRAKVGSERKRACVSTAPGAGRVHRLQYRHVVMLLSP